MVILFLFVIFYIIIIIFIYFLKLKNMNNKNYNLNIKNINEKIKFVNDKVVYVEGKLDVKGDLELIEVCKREVRKMDEDVYVVELVIMDLVDVNIYEVGMGFWNEMVKVVKELDRFEVM